MRIISSWKDYYDIGMQFGLDSGVTWVRETEEAKALPGLSSDWFYEYRLGSKNYCVAYLALCGKIHPIHGEEGGIYTKPNPDLFSNSYEGAVERFEKFKNEKVRNPENPYEGYFLKKFKYEIEAFIAKPCHDLHLLYDCPVLLFSEKCIDRRRQITVTKCPVLRDLGFQRVKDPYTLFQEIETYISNNMCQKQNPMVVLSDKSKIIKHGFDYKTSFRKGKQA